MADLKVTTPAQHIRVLTFLREERRNALSLGLIAELTQQILQAQNDGMRVVVLAGEGTAFSAGADFSDLLGDRADLQFDEAMAGLTTLIRQSPIISFAAVHGACVGAGLDLALACDFRVASPGAFFALPAVKMGILYNPQRLQDVLADLNPAFARRLLLLSETLPRDEALSAGLVTHGVDVNEAELVDHVVTALASKSVVLPSLAQGITKAFLKARTEAGFRMEPWQVRRMELLSSEERKAALSNARKRGK